jgi:hypothetical protein
MSMRARRFLTLVAAIAATSVSALSLASNAEAAPCGSRAGVTVVVEYGDPLGASVGCATDDPTTGLEALKSAGHRYTFVPRQPGFVCTIDARPNPCNNGPANAYWSYWHAQPGGSWSYGSIGAGSYDPPSGSVEGWAFGSGKPPRSRPPVVGTSGNATSGSAASATGATPSATADARTSTPATRNLPPDARGGLGGLVAGVGLIVLLGGLAAYLARRRPQAGR